VRLAAPVPVGLEKGVEVELVELAAAGDRQQFVRHLIGQQPHLRQRAVGVPLPGCWRRSLLGTLLVGVGPVEDLLLDELARRQRLERRAGEVEVGLGGDGQELGFLFREHGQVLVHVLQPACVFELGFLFRDSLFLALEQFLGRLAPRAEVVFVEHHEVPVHRVQPLVLGLDVAGRIAAEQVLERAEVDERLLAKPASGRCRTNATGTASHRNPRGILRSVCQASSTAGLKVTTSTRAHRASSPAGRR
jgi:hypothetical protein